MRDRFPLIAKIAAALIFLGVAVQMGAYFVRKLNPNRPERSPNVQLPGQLTAVFDAFKYVHHDDGRTKYILTAAKDQVFGDGHHDLADVKLEIFGADGSATGLVTSKRCRYDQAQALVRFEESVFIETADGLKIKTERVDYNQQSNRAETDERVEFVRDRVHEARAE